MADKNVNIKITAESKDAEKGINKVTTAVNKLGKSSTIRSVNQLASAVTNSISAFNSLKSAVDSAVAAVNECAEAYSKQRSAELALETAAKNNPYLNASNVSALKKYATELSKLSGIADEDLLPTMTKLAQSGRTESEIMKIMSAATDVAASGVMGFDQACDALNKTFVGEMGSLKELNPLIAQMTAEDLKAGKAVDALATSFAGTAASMGDITGGAERLKNAMTSLKEEIGAGFAAPVNSFKTAMSEVLEGFAEMIKKSREAKQEAEAVAEIRQRMGSGEAVSIEEQVREAEQTLAELNRAKNELWGTLMRDISPEIYTSTDMVEKRQSEILSGKVGYLRKEAEAYNNTLAEIEATEKRLSDLKDEQARATEQAARDAEAQAQAQAAQEAQDKKNADAQAMIDAYKQRVEAVKAEIAARRELGEEIDGLAEKEQVYKAMYSGLVNLVSGSGGLITVNNGFFKSESGNVAKLAEQMLSEYEKLAREKAEAINALLEEGLLPDDARLKEEIASLEELNSRIRELGGEPVEIAIAVDGGGEDDFEEKLKEFKEALDAAMPSPDEWRQLSDSLLEFAEGLEELRGNIPEEEFAALEERVREVREALTAPELDGWQKLTKEAEDIAERVKEIEEKAKAAADEGKLDLEKAYLEEVERLNEEAAKKSADAWSEYVSQMKEKLTSVVSQVTSSLSQVTSIVSDTCSLMLEGVETRLDLTLAKLETAYLSGEMGEEEYNEAVIKAKKEAAQAEYKIEMWEWTASILTATANIAEGITKAIAQGGVAGIVTGALVSAAGAVQIATLIANKPIPPTFSTGGIVGGNSYTGDHVQALLNSGEMVLNAGQQRNLFDSINSGNISKGAASGQSSQTYVQVNNSASNIVSAEPEVSENQINLAIDMRVNSSLKKGRYGSALAQAEQNKTGKWYGS